MSSCWWHQHSCVVEFDEFSREKPVQREEVFISKNSYHYVKRRLNNSSSFISWAVTLLIYSGGQITKSVTFFLTVSVVDEKNKKRKRGICCHDCRVSGCIQSSIQINNLDVWGFIFFCVVTCFRWRKECFPTDQNSYQSPFVV